MKTIILVTVGLLNVFLLYTNTQRQSRVNILTNQLTACEQQTTHASHTGTHIKLPASFINPGYTLSLITIFPEQGCSICIREEIRLLNELHIRYDPYFYIYILNEYIGDLKNMGATFPYEELGEVPHVEELTIDNPVTLIVDRNNTVQLIHKAETGNLKKSQLFFERVESLFESVYGY
jgi:hypothetical protein